MENTQKKKSREESWGTSGPVRYGSLAQEEKPCSKPHRISPYLSPPNWVREGQGPEGADQSSSLVQGLRERRGENGRKVAARDWVHDG